MTNFQLCPVTILKWLPLHCTRKQRKRKKNLTLHNHAFIQCGSKASGASGKYIKITSHTAASPSNQQQSKSKWCAWFVFCVHAAKTEDKILASGGYIPSFVLSTNEQLWLNSPTQKQSTVLYAPLKGSLISWSMFQIWAYFTETHLSNLFR